MIRLYLTVEGQTEAAFAKRILEGHLANFQVYLWQPRFTGLHGRRGGRIPKGGLLGTFKHALADIRRWMKEDRSAEARFSMMVDLYSLPKDFPGWSENSGKFSGAELAAVLEEALMAELGDSRFVPYLQVHEFEALVLSEPDRLNTLYPAYRSKITKLTEECARFGTPEEINHGRQSHPKFRIHHIIPEYDENMDGPKLAGDIGLETLRARCPHFGAWLTRLENLDSM